VLLHSAKKPSVVIFIYNKSNKNEHDYESVTNGVMLVSQKIRNVGRPTVINSDTVRKLEQAFRDGFSVSRACELSSIGRTVFYDHLKASEEFANKMRLAQEWPQERARQVVVSAVVKGDVSAAKWLLEKKASDEFGQRTQLSIENPIEVSSEVIMGDLDDLIEWRKRNRTLRRSDGSSPGSQPSSEPAKE
jgi:hypothetical protein